MIIRRRRLNEAPTLKDIFKDTVFDSNSSNGIDELVGKVISNTDNYKAFKNLKPSTKQSFYKACKNELENSEKSFPFFGLMNQNGANEVITDINQSFLKFYNGCLNNNLSYTKVREGKKGNILLVKDLYSKSDWDKIASLYYDTRFNNKWKDKIKDQDTYDDLIEIISKNGISAKKFPDPEKYKQEFINYIFYDDGKVRSLNNIKAILNVLNKDEESEEDRWKKKLSNAKSEEELKKIANSLDKDQSASLIQLLQQKIK